MELAAPSPSRPQRLALLILQIGIVAVVLAASTHHVFELDRFLIPKELVLHLTAVLAGILTVRAIARTIGSWVDLLLIAWLILSVVSAALATNYWLAFRALAFSASCVLIFWIARALSAHGLARPLLRAIAFAIVLAAVTSLVQAYGVEIDLFSENRAPGGTLGNRNFVAHAAAFGLPIVLLVALTARATMGFVAGGAGVAIVTAALVLTRSRAAWLAAAAMLIAFFIGVMRSDGRTWRRVFGIATLAAVGAAAALLIPNTLRWRSDNPYLDSVAGVVNYEEGSGRGRLVQYENSLRMAVVHPLLGVGPGNWSVIYPQHARRNDPSMDPSRGGMTFNPWPSSDWIAFVSERGFPAAIAMVLVFAVIAIDGLRRIVRAPDVDGRLTGAALLATAVAAIVAGMFDAVLLLALPGLIVWASLGALLSPVEKKRLWPALIVVAVLAVSALGAARSVAQVVAMDIFARNGSRTSLEVASQIDPGNYRIHLRLAKRCAHARAAHALYPSSEEARALSRACGD